MGTSSSRDAALEQASERLEEAQLRKVEELFEKLSTSGALDRQKFKVKMSVTRNKTVLEKCFKFQCILSILKGSFFKLLPGEFHRPYF